MGDAENGLRRRANVAIDREICGSSFPVELDA
jgi:hypothetical protein